MKAYQLLIISIMLHLWLYSMALLIPDLRPKNLRLQDIEVVYQNETQTKKNNLSKFIDYAPSEQEDQSLDLLKQSVKRLSRIARRVEQEVVARKNGPTQNQQKKLSPNLRNKILEDLKSNNNQSFQAKTEATDLDAPSISKPPPSQAVGQTQMTDSSISNYIPEVRSGGFTSLNSDQFVHYTFYARTNEQIRNRWIDNIRRFLANTPQTELNRLANNTQISQVEILLNRQGQFVKALIHQHSANRELDESAISAFRLASPLNNPPEEMIEEDGFIHLRYAFYVFLRPSYIASGSK